MTRKAFLSAALFLAVAFPAHAEPIHIPMTADKTNANWCYVPTPDAHWTVEIGPGQLVMTSKTEIVQKSIIPVAADGSFDKEIELLSSNTFSSRLRIWGNVRTREFNSHNFRRFCKYHGTW